MRPVRVKSSATPPSPSNFQGLQEMSDAEINQYLSYILTNKFAAETDGTGTAELNVDTANANVGTSIGTFIDSKRDDAIGTHPTAGAVTNTTYYFKQVETVASESITNRPLGNDATGINKFSDAELDTVILDKVIEDMVNETAYTVGQYALSVTTPVDAGTWTERYIITNTTQSGDNTIKLWQKTTPNSAADSNLAPLKVFNTSDIKVMTAAEIEELVPNFRNRIIASGVGTYKIQTSAPLTGGTWVQQGDAGGFIDTRQEVLATNYQGTFTGFYEGTYTLFYSGFVGTPYTGNYSGDYTQDFSGDTIENTTENNGDIIKLWLRTA